LNISPKVDRDRAADTVKPNLRMIKRNNDSLWDRIAQNCFRQKSQEPSVDEDRLVFSG